MDTWADPTLLVLATGWLGLIGVSLTFEVGLRWFANALRQSTQ